MTLTAYPQGKAQQAAIIAELEAHAKADRLVKGRYWENGKGCAVGCTIKSGDHAEYEPRFGIPQALARLEDVIFENLPNELAMSWPVRFMSAAQVGADLSLVQWQFLEFVVSEALNRDSAKSVREKCQPALDIVRAKARGETVSARAAERAAWSAWSAESAAWSAASAASAARAAWSAARAASAESAARAARAAWSAESAASAARAAWSAESAASAARAASAESADSAAWVRYSEKLLELMSDAPVFEQVPA